MKKIILVVCLAMVTNVLIAKDTLYKVVHGSDDIRYLFIESLYEGQIPYKFIDGFIFFDREIFLNIMGDTTIVSSYSDENGEVDVIEKSGKIAYLLDLSPKFINMPLEMSFNQDHGSEGGCYGSCARDLREAYRNRARSRHSTRTRRMVEKARRDRHMTDLKQVARVGAAIGIGASLGGGVSGAVKGGVGAIIREILH